MINARKTVHNGFTWRMNVLCSSAVHGYLLACLLVSALALMSASFAAAFTSCRPSS